MQAFPPSVRQDEVTFPLVSLVWKILGGTGRSGSLIYEGNCSPGKPDDPFRSASPRPGASPLQALNEAFAHDPRLTARQESGLIRVTGGKVPRGLLDVQISQVSFRDEDDPRDAVQKLLALPEVRDYMRGHHMEFPMVQGGIFALPRKGGPVLNGTMRGETLFQVLDRIVRTFPGVWVYRACSMGRGKRSVYIGFLGTSH